MAFSQPASGGSIFSGYFNQYHQNVYGVPAPQYSVNDMNNMMAQQQRPVAQGQRQQGGGKQEDGPAQDIADAYSYYDKAKDMYDTYQNATAAAEMESTLAATEAGYGTGAGVFPSGAASTGASSGELAYGAADTGYSGMTSWTGAGTTTGTTAGTGTTAAGGTAAGGTAAGGTAAGTGTGTAASSGAGAGYGVAGIYAAIAALGYNALQHEWYDPEDIFTGSAPAERWENMDVGKNASKSFENIFGEGTGKGAEATSRLASWDPREQWKGLKDIRDVNHALGQNALSMNRDFFKNNDVGKVLSGSGINREMGRGVTNIWDQHEENRDKIYEQHQENRGKVLESVKKASNPFKWFD